MSNHSFPVCDLWIIILSTAVSVWSHSRGSWFQRSHSNECKVSEASTHACILYKWLCCSDRCAWGLGLVVELSRTHTLCTLHDICTVCLCHSRCLWFNDPYLNWAWACAIEAACIHNAILGVVNKHGQSKAWFVAFRLIPLPLVHACRVKMLSCLFGVLSMQGLGGSTRDGNGLVPPWGLCLGRGQGALWGIWKDASSWSFKSVTESKEERPTTGEIQCHWIWSRHVSILLLYCTR